MVLVHVRRVLAKRPWLYWVGVGGLALLAGVIVSQAASGIDDAKAAWGEPHAVLVAVADIEPGASVAGADGAPRDPGAARAARRRHRGRAGRGRAAAHRAGRGGDGSRRRRDRRAAGR